MDETQDPKPHPHINGLQHTPHETAPGAADTHPALHAADGGRAELSIWFFCGILTLVYGVVLTAQGIYEHFGHQPNTVLADLQPTFWWGVALDLFGLFYTIRFRPGKA